MSNSELFYLSHLTAHAGHPVTLTGCILGEAGVEILCNAMSKPRSCPRALYLPSEFHQPRVPVGILILKHPHLDVCAFM